MSETIDKRLLKKAREDQEFMGKIAKSCGKTVATVIRWLDGDYDNLPPIAYKMIEKHFNSK